MSKVKPVSGLFGVEIDDQIADLKSIQEQCISCLASNATVVTLPALVDGDTPIDVLRKRNAAIAVALAGASIVPVLPTFSDVVKTIGGQQCQVNSPIATASVAATLTLKSVTPVNLITITAKTTGEGGNVITVAVAAGSVSGKKVTVVAYGVTTVMDDLADVPAIVAAINAANIAVIATQITTGTVVNSSAANLAGGVDGVDANVALNDGSLSKELQVVNSFIKALQVKGWLY